MKNFDAIIKACKDNSKMVSLLVEDYLLKNVVNLHKLVPEMEARLAKYKHITVDFQEEWVNMLKMQYIAHEICKKNGLINGYLNHSAVKRLSQNEQNFLQQLASRPWRFSFSILTGRPAEEFFEMEDVFTGESYLLYSPGIAKFLKEKPVLLWFNLIGYNGACWQTFGPLGAYKSFQPDDIFFFATELRSGIQTEEDLMADVEKNPVPYMMLLSGSEYPLTFHKDDLILQVWATYDIDELDTSVLKKDFKIEYNSHVYKLDLKRWSGHPHFASAFYDEKEKTLSLHAMTDRGFGKLVEYLNESGMDISDEPDIRASMAMFVTAQKIFRKKIVLNPYDHLFVKEQSQEVRDETEKINNMLAMMLPDINAGRTPDIKFLAQKAGVDEEAARDLLKQIMNKFGSLPS